MKQIQSTTHPLVKHIVRLHTSEGRSLHQQFIAEGKRTCQTLIDSGYVPLHLCMTQPIYNCEENSFVSDNLIIVSDRVMNKISAATSPSGILGVFSIPPHNIN